MTIAAASKIAAFLILFTLATTVAHADPSFTGLWGDSLIANLGPSVGTVYNGGKGGDTCKMVFARFLSSPKFWNATDVFWCGHNGIDSSLYSDQIIPSIDAMIRLMIPPKRFLVLSLLNAESEPAGSINYNTKMRINAQMAAHYGVNYLDVRKILLANANYAIPADRDDYQHDIVPMSLRIDDLHLNAQGNTIVVNAIGAKLGLLGTR